MPIAKATIASSKLVLELHHSTACKADESTATTQPGLDHTAGLKWRFLAGESIIFFFLTGLRERDKREKSEEKIDCHHQDSNQGPSLVASDALNH